MLPRFKEQKALAAILYVADSLTQKTPEKRADLYKLLKVLYFADKCHLAKYGRPITGDTYVAMKDGPVPSRAYDILKQVRGDGSYWSDDGDFAKKIKQSINFSGNITIDPQLPANTDNLSETDMESLDRAIDSLKDLLFPEIKKLSHDKAYDSADESNCISLEKVAIAGGANEVMLLYFNTWLENQVMYSA